MMEEMKQQFLTGERALFQGHDLPDYGYNLCRR